MSMIRLYTNHLHGRRTLGIMSGTSLDGVDLSLVRFTRRYTIAEHKTRFTRFPVKLRKSLFELAASAEFPKDRLLSTDIGLGTFYLRSAESFLGSPEVGTGGMDLVGCHGQTVYHRSGSATGSPTGSLTLQIGSPDVLAQGLGVPVISDFRSADIAAGGRGAPLTPIAHHYMFGAHGSRVLVVNIGGISNATYLPGDGDISDVIATDCGPGNMLIDQVCSRLFNKPFDPDGVMASAGSVHAGLLRMLKNMSFLRRGLPMALGREQFGEPVIDRVLDYASRAALDRHSVLCTVGVFTSHCITRVARKLPGIDRILICGGGAHNEFVISSLRESFRGIELGTTADCGIDPDFVESASFALLANLAVDGVPGNLPQVTGAARQVILGKMTLI